MNLVQTNVEINGDATSALLFWYTKGRCGIDLGY